MPLDGVVIDTEPLYAKGETKLFKEYGVIIPEEDWKLFRGCTEEKFYDLSMKKYNITENREVFIAKGRQYIISEFKNHLSFMDGFKNFISRLDGRLQLGLVTASPEKMFSWVNKRLHLDSIFEHIPRDWFLKQTLEEDYIDSGNCYEYYYAIGNYYKPQTILEIGLLFGYSAAALILGAKENIKVFDSYDIDHYDRNFFAKSPGTLTEYDSSLIEYEDWSSNKIAYYKLHDLLEEKIPGNEISLNIMLKDSRHLKYLDKNYDLIHIDGSHYYEDKLHDLQLTLGRCNVVVVDDYDFIESNKRAVDEFIDLNKKYILNINHVKSFRGTMIIEYKNFY